MSKTKQKDHNELRFLQGEIRRLQKENRSLRRENSYYKKHQHLYQESQNEEIHEEQEIKVIKNKHMCPDCAKGILQEFEIMPGKVFRTCPICEYREKVK